jgi:hypothetical protein
MGRPLKKDTAGTQVLGLSTLGNTGIKVVGRFAGATSNDYSVIKQRGARTFVVARDENFTCDTTSGSPIVINMSDQNEVTVGDEVSGAGIPTGTYILSIDSATQVTLSKNATATATGVTLYHIGGFVTGYLVDKTADNLANGEIIMSGRVAADASDVTNKRNIAKITKRVVTDFAGNRYTWSLLDDSSSDDIVLVAI